MVQYPYDPEAARAVFAGKGYSVTLLCGDDGDDLAIAEIIRNGLTAAGIEVAVEAHDSATRDGRINSGDYEFALVGNGGWGNNPPPTCAPCSPTSPSSPAPTPTPWGPSATPTPR
ncbi:ABC transporter substrate-binding protein [Flavonifractor plautii]|nr:ABC transporter substrate-binding protein [Flavonifractor plautii]